MPEYRIENGQLVELETRTQSRVIGTEEQIEESLRQAGAEVARLQQAIREIRRLKGQAAPGL